MDPVLVVGLGNPGSGYERTRHNVGFRVVDRICERFRAPIRPGKGEFEFAQIPGAETDLVVLKPLTFMNNSGIAVKDAMERFGVPLSGLLIVLDDVDLPLGKLRLRPGGSDGGHNGLASVIYHLEADQFSRLRCGVGAGDPPKRTDLAEFVLSPFGSEERESVAAMIDRGADAAVDFARYGIERAMNGCNS